MHAGAPGDWFGRGVRWRSLFRWRQAALVSWGGFGCAWWWGGRPVAVWRMSLAADRRNRSVLFEGFILSRLRVSVSVDWMFIHA